MTTPVLILLCALGALCGALLFLTAHYARVARTAKERIRVLLEEEEAEIANRVHIPLAMDRDGVKLTVDAWTTKQIMARVEKEHAEKKRIAALMVSAAPDGKTRH